MFGCLMWSTLYFILYDMIFYEKERASVIICVAHSLYPF